MLDQLLNNTQMQIQIIKQHQQNVNIMPQTQIKRGDPLKNGFE
jgi:hypothetical protein